VKKFFIVLLLATFSASAAYAQVKLGYINSDQILLEFEESLDAMSKLEAENKRLQEEYQKMQTRMIELTQEFEKKKFVATETWKTQKQTEIEKLGSELQNYQMEKFGPQGEIYRKESEYLGPVLEKINLILKKVGEEGKYDYIMDGAKGVIVYADPKHDLTNTVLYELRKSGTGNK